MLILKLLTTFIFVFYVKKDHYLLMILATEGGSSLEVS
jgi:hypothetical protein